MYTLDTYIRLVVHTYAYCSSYLALSPTSIVMYSTLCPYGVLTSVSPKGGGGGKWGTENCVHTAQDGSISCSNVPRHKQLQGAQCVKVLGNPNLLALQPPAIVKVFSMVSWPVFPSTCLLKVRQF